MPIPSSAGSLLLGLIAAVAVLSTLLSTAALFWVTRRKRPLPDFTPPVTIFKPLKGVDDCLEANLRSFFRLDYPVFQLLFRVADENDPAAAVVERLLAEFPEHDARLILGGPAFGLNPKVESLAIMSRFRKHDFILISDSNIRVRPSYLRETVCHLQDPKVGLVSNLFVGTGDVTAGAAFDNLQVNGFVAGNVALASILNITCVIGKSMLMPVRVLDEIGGFGSVRNFLGEDQLIGILVKKAGYSIRLSPHIVENVNQSRSTLGFLSRQSRWYKVRRGLALAAFLSEPCVNLTTVGIVWALSSGSGLAWSGFFVLTGLGVFRDALHTKLLRNTYPRARYWLLSPVKDVFLLPVWFDAIFNPKIFWRGRQYWVGRYTRLRASRATRVVRKRVRSVRRVRKVRAREKGDA